MRITWVVGFLMLFLIGQIVSLTLEGVYFGGEIQHDPETGEPVGAIAIFFGLMRPEFVSFTNPLIAIGGFFIWVWEWIQALWKVFWWDYAFLTGYWEILKYFGWCISMGMIVSIVLAVRGTGST